MLFLRNLARVLSALSFISLVAMCSAEAAQFETKRPIYAIAHRVLKPSDVTAALSHGANALEIDLTAWDFQWWANHDGTFGSVKASAIELFEFIAQQRYSGQNIAFVWLDIKNPDSCSIFWPCSIEGLRDLVRQTLEPAGVRALYGFFESENSHGYKVIRDSLNTNEAVCLSGPVGKVLDLYNTTAKDIPARQRIMDYGDARLDKEFGNCQGNGGTCSELRQGSEDRDRGELGKVFGWTSAEGDTELVNKLLGEAGVDGIIYGFQSTEYKDESGPRAASQDIIDFVNSHPDTHRIAGQNDAPW